MGLWVRWSWLLLVSLVCGSGFGSATEHVLVKRQSDTWWRNYHPSVHEWGTPRRSSLVAAQPVSGWGPFVRGGAAQSRQLQPPQDSPISVQCGEDKMVVTVERDLYGNGKLVKASDLTLGPLSCKPGPQSTGTSVVFENGLQECGNSLQMTPDWLIYITNLKYSPTSPSGVPITRTNPAVVPIQCFYPRHGNVSSNAIKPTWVPFSTTVSSEERLSFSLQLMTDDWSAPRSSSVFQLGDMFSIEASVDTQNHVPMILFIDRCVATVSPDVSSNPHYEIITSNGCLMDGKQEDSSSAFRSPRPQPDKLQFMVDAFRFIGTDVSVVYLTCYLKAAAVNQAPDAMNKACSYRKTSSSWFAVEGSNAICQCCDTGNCAAGQSRRLVSGGRPRGLGKREIAAGPSTEEHGLATLGPLLVVGAEPVQASRTTAESEHLELWVLVTIVSVSLVVVVGCFILTIKHVLKRRANVLVVEE
ncbi:zona pellucida sperm-binding protein 3-like isoform X1 [Mixophyes fleayi]|uniref:zona pellucida sperm-binding protein 3-like isoform X1 n=1 Tax=Mixophyes fleayi TaxID=3061075 RepID=UPI003F4DA0E5